MWWEVTAWENGFWTVKHKVPIPYRGRAGHRGPHEAVRKRPVSSARNCMCTYFSGFSIIGTALVSQEAKGSVFQKGKELTEPRTARSWALRLLLVGTESWSGLEGAGSLAGCDRKSTACGSRAWWLWYPGQRSILYSELQWNSWRRSPLLEVPGEGPGLETARQSSPGGGNLCLFCQGSNVEAKEQGVRFRGRKA